MRDLLEIFSGLLLVSAIGLLSYSVVAYAYRNLHVLVHTRNVSYIRYGLLGIGGTIGVVLASITWNPSSIDGAAGA
jgi:hypothetical protein